MKHANIINVHCVDPGKYVEAELAEGQKLFLTESLYTREELDSFNAEKSKWIVRRAGTRYFLADSDSGEDSEGYYCGYFDLRPENAVFEGGRLVGYYICPGDLRYSGLSRSSFDVDKWGYPGYDPFASASGTKETHVFLFSEPKTCKWKDWYLLARDPEKEYRSYLDF